MEIAHESLHLDKYSFVHWKIRDTHTTFIWIIIFFGVDFEYGGISKFWGHAGTNAELYFV
jgi:hypothetical protein